MDGRCIARSLGLFRGKKVSKKERKPCLLKLQEVLIMNTNKGAGREARNFLLGPAAVP